MRSWTFVAAGLAFALGGLVAHRPVSAQVVVALSGTPAPGGLHRFISPQPERRPGTSVTRIESRASVGSPAGCRPEGRHVPENQSGREDFNSAADL